MSEKPILFNGDMVRAIIDGRKTQTRRVVKPQPSGEVPRSIMPGWYEPLRVGTDGIEYPGRPVYGFASEYQDWPSPFGAPGDRLWVRETWSPDHAAFYPNFPLVYRADFGPEYERNEKSEVWSDEQQNWYPFRWRPSIHMPREVCRLTLDVTAVRVERLQDISEQDADAEVFGGDFPHKVLPGMFHPNDSSLLSLPECFARLWDSIANPGEKWDDNPYVWVVEFTRKTSNL
jgi:hypothetical protein